MAEPVSTQVETLGSGIPYQSLFPIFEREKSFGEPRDLVQLKEALPHMCEALIQLLALHQAT